MGVKLFSIGLAKTGSISIKTAWEILGYRSLHYPVAWSEIDRYDAANGTSVACRFEEVDRRYQGSKFILTVRALDPWLKSCEAHYCQRFRQEDLAPKHREFRRRCMLKLYGSETYNPELFTQAYYRHCDRVKNYFEGRPQDFLVMNIPEGDGWDKICPFLDKDIPDVPFPHSNKTAEPMTLRQEVARRVAQVSEPWMDYV